MKKQDTVKRLCGAIVEVMALPETADICSVEVNDPNYLDDMIFLYEGLTDANLEYEVIPLTDFYTRLHAKDSEFILMQDLPTDEYERRKES